MTQVPDELWRAVWHLATGKTWPPAGPDSVQQFFEYANREMLLPLLMVAEGLPEPILHAKSRYRSFQALYRKRYELMRAALPTLQRVAGGNSFLFYKGSDFCHRLYSRPDLRPMTDVDVLVPGGTFGEVLNRFARNGIAPKHGSHGTSFSPDHHEVSIMIGEMHIEIHRSFTQRIKAKIDYDALWRRRESFTADGLSGLRLSAPDALLVQAHELAKDEFSSPLIRYMDFYLLVRAQPEALSLCVERAKQWRLQSALFGALFLTARLFPALQGEPRVMRAQRDLLTPSRRRALAERVLPDPAREPSSHVTGRLLQIRRKIQLIDSFWRRLAFLGFATQQEIKGSLHEWRARRAGVKLPPRWRRVR